GLLFAPLLARYQFIPTLSRIITTATHEGYSLAELALTLFYLDVFGFRSLEDFKRAYAEEFGVLMGRTQSPSLFTLRRFLHKVRKLGQGEALIDEFARTYLQSGLAAWAGWLSVVISCRTTGWFRLARGGPVGGKCRMKAGSSF